MTMHLVGPYMTTTNYRKQKQKKMTSAKLDKLRVEWRAYNKRMRKANCHSAQFDEFDDYVAYTQGKAPKVQKSAEFQEYKPQKSVNPRETQTYPSLSNNIAGFAPRKESPVYSGERQLLGIATMHKSNMVPVFADKKEEAKEIASMRR